MRTFFFTCATVLTMLVGSTSAVLAGQPLTYHFTSIADTRDGFSEFVGESISMNNSGTVAFYAGFEGRNRAVFTGNGQDPLTTIFPDVSYGDLFYQTSINERGTVAFNSAHPEARGLFTSTNGRLTLIYNDPLVMTAYPSLNNKGSIAFENVPSFGEEYSVQFASGGEIRQVPGVGRVIGLSLNDKDILLFVALTESGYTRLMTSHAGGPATVIADADNTVFQSFFSPIINNRGTIAFNAALDDGGQGVFMLTVGQIATVADSRGPFNTFGASSINNKGEVAFLASLDSGTFGIYTGPDPIADKVIEAGDPLFGSTVTAISLDRQGLNDRGEVAFLAHLADGRQVIVRACPVRRE